MAVLAAVTSLHETRLVRFIERASLTVTGITNLGALTVGTRAGPLDIRSLHFAVAPFVLTRLMATATTFDGVLRVNFSYQEPSLSEARVRRVVDAAMEKIAGAIT